MVRMSHTIAEHVDMDLNKDAQPCQRQEQEAWTEDGRDTDLDLAILPRSTMWKEYTWADRTSEFAGDFSSFSTRLKQKRGNSAGSLLTSCHVASYVG